LNLVGLMSGFYTQLVNGIQELLPMVAQHWGVVLDSRSGGRGRLGSVIL
jgi:hypothetical protein